MRLYSTDAGVAREDSPGMLSLLALDHTDVGEVLRRGDLERARTAAVTSTRPVHDVTLRAPVPAPGQVVIAGLNYPSHAEEARELAASLGREFSGLPTEPSFQLLPITAAHDPDAAIRVPAAAPDQVDYEGEVAVVIGRTADDVPVERAWDCVAGLTIANDVSARDVQLSALLSGSIAGIADAKSFPTFKPMGPCLVTADEFTLPVDLRIRTRVNGELRQDDRTATMLFDFPTLVSAVSRRYRLEPGDVILTGTPSGAGAFCDAYLTEGDVVEVEVERLGVLRNPVGWSRSVSSASLRR